MTQPTTRTLPPPDGICAVTDHLVVDHGWPARTPISGEHALAHDYLHGVGRADLADPTLTHIHSTRRRPPAAPEPTTDEREPSTWRDDSMPVILAGLVAMAVGLLMPWLTAAAVFVGQISRNGLDTDDGKLLGVGVLILLSVAMGDLARPRRGNSIALLVGSCLALIVLVVDHSNMSSRIADINDSHFGYADIGYGLYVTGVGAFLVAVGAWQRLHSTR